MRASRADNGVYSGRGRNLMNDGIKEREGGEGRERERKNERIAKSSHAVFDAKSRIQKSVSTTLAGNSARRDNTLFFPFPSFFQSQFMSRGKYFNLFFWREMGTVDLYASPFEGNVGKNFHANVPLRRATER